MRGKPANKQWLSLHQCIDEYCPVHAGFNVKPVACYSAGPKVENKNQNFNSEYGHDTLTTNKINQRCENGELGEKQSYQHEDDNNAITVDLSHVTGALKTTAKCYEASAVTCSPSESLKKLMQAYGENAAETLDKTDVNGRVNKEITEVAKPRFLCTWLNKHVNINNFPFYKLAVCYGSQNRVRKDAAIYSRFVTNQIWSTHKYIGSKDDTDRNETTSKTRASVINASRSHENLSIGVDSVIKDIPEIDISDLKLKYGFLFNPNYLFKNSYQNNTEKAYVQNKHCGPQYVCQYLDQNNGTENSNVIGEPRYEVYSVQHRQEDHSQSYDDQHLNGHLAHKNDEIQPSLSHQSTLNSRYIRTDNLILQTDQLEGYIYSSDHAPSDIGVNSYVCSPYVSRQKVPSGSHGSVREHNNDRTNIRPDRFVNDENTSTSFCDNPDSPYTGTYINYVPDSYNNFADNNYETSPSSYSLDSNLGNRNSMDNAVHKPSIRTPYSSYNTGSPYHRSALHAVSPLVSSPALSHYVSPAVHLNSPNLSSNSFYYYTKRTEDPRRQAKCSENRSDRQRISECADVARIVNTPDQVCVSDHPLSFTYNEKNIAYHDSHARHEFDITAHEKRGTRSNERSQQFQYFSDDEDPLHGLADPTITARQNPEKYIDSPNSELFYGIDNNQNTEEHCVDDLMDIFYAGNCYHEHEVNGYAFVPRHKSRYSERSRSREIRSRSRHSMCDVIRRVRSRSPESSVMKSRYRSYRSRPTSSSQTDIRRHNFSTRHLGNSAKRRQYRNFRESSITRTDRKLNGHSACYKRKSERREFAKRDLERRKRHAHDYRRERSRVSISPDVTSSRLKESRNRNKIGNESRKSDKIGNENRKIDKTGACSVSARSSNSDMKKKSDSQRCYDHKRLKDTHNKKEERTKHSRRR